MNLKVFYVCAIVTASFFQFHAPVQAQRSSSVEKPVANKVVKEPTLKREKETRGEVEFSDYELIWPSIETHERATVTVFGNCLLYTSPSPRD